MEKLKFTSDAFFNGHKQLLLEMVDDRLHIVYGNLFTDIESERLLSPKETKYYVDHINDLHIELWDETSPSDELDHISWEVEYDGTVHKGHHVHPDNYELFLDVLDQLVPEAKLVDHDEIIEAVIGFKQESLMINRHFHHVSYLSKLSQFDVTDERLVDRLMACLTRFQSDDEQWVMAIEATRRGGQTTVYHLDRLKAAGIRKEIASLLESGFNHNAFQM